MIAAARNPTVEGARRYLAKCPPAVSGQGGDNATFRVAAILVHGFGLSEADALALIMEWNLTCVPPWTPAELLRKLRSAAKAPHRKPRGHLLGGSAATYPQRSQTVKSLVKAKPLVIDPVAETKKYLNGFQ